VKKLSSIENVNRDLPSPACSCDPLPTSAHQDGKVIHCWPTVNNFCPTGDEHLPTVIKQCGTVDECWETDDKRRQTVLKQYEAVDKCCTTVDEHRPSVTSENKYIAQKIGDSG
jgi:hypothetical protein